MRPEISLARRWAALLVLVLAACGGDGPDTRQDSPRVITLGLWAGLGAGAAPAGALPVIEVVGRSGATLRGPLPTTDPVGGGTILAYERIAETKQGRRRQILHVTQDGAGLGRVLDAAEDGADAMPDRIFSGDVVFPLGRWNAGETRQFMAVEHTLFGPAQRYLHIEILELDFVHDGIDHSLAYRLTVRDEAERVLSCEYAVYSPGVGLAASKTGSQWSDGGSCED